MRKKKILTPLDCAVKNRYDLIEWHKLTKEDITQTNSNGVSLLVGIVGDGQWTNLPPKLKEFSLTQPKGPSGNEKIIHLMTRQGKIDTIPTSLITKDLLSLKGARGESVYHILTDCKYTDQIEKSLWTREALTLTSDDGTTPLHKIAPHKPKLLPDDITIEDLLLKNKDGDTPLYMWVTEGEWLEIPDKFLTRNTLGLHISFKTPRVLMHYLAFAFDILPEFLIRGFLGYNL